MSILLNDDGTPFYHADEKTTFEIILHPGVRASGQAPLIWWSFLWTQPCLLVSQNPVQTLTRRGAWPKYKDLERREGTRKLSKVYPFDGKMGLSQFAGVYFGPEFSSIQVIIQLGPQRQSPRLVIKDPKCSKITLPYSPDSTELVVQVQGNWEIKSVLENTVFPTVCEVLRLISNFVEGSPFAQALRFYDVSKDYSVHHAVWDVYSFQKMFHVVYIDPTHLSKADMTKMTMSDRNANSATFQFGELDAFGKKDVKGKQKETAVTDDGITKELWAVLYDICAPPNGCAFAVTNYNYWQFGYFEEDREIAHITLPIKAAIDCQVNLPRSMYALPFNGEPNALQMLVFWIQSARGLTKVPLV